MKRLLLTLTLVVATAATMFGQGRVSFNNSASGNVISITTNPLNAAPGQGAPGALLTSTYSIQLLWAPQGTYASEAAFMAAVVGSGPAVAFLDANPGLFAGGATPSPAGTTMPVAAYTMAARAWYNNGQFATYDAARTGNANVGFSPFFNLTPTASPTPAPVTLGLQSFTVQGIVPEPSTFALAGLGAAALLLFRRRK